MKPLTKKDMSTALTFWYILKNMMHTTSCSSNMCYTLFVVIQVPKGSFFVIFQYASTHPNAHTLFFRPGSGRLANCLSAGPCFFVEFTASVIYTLLPRPIAKVAKVNM